MLSRILSLPEHNSVIIGRDLESLLQKGVIYEIKEYMGELILKPIGESAINNIKERFGTVDSIFTMKPHAALYTMEEFNMMNGE